MSKIRVGIIDDDETKVTQIFTLLLEGWDKAAPQKKAKYSQYELIPVEIPLKQSIDDVVVVIQNTHVECVLIDYRLTSYGKNNYTGVELSQEILRRRHGFPIFILTSYEDEIYTKELFDVYQIFDFDRYMNDTAERVELNTKIVEQVQKYRKELTSWEKELLDLLPHAGDSAVTDARILLLDSYIENAIDGKHLIPAQVKNQLTKGKIDALLEKLDRLLE